MWSEVSELIIQGVLIQEVVLKAFKKLFLWASESERIYSEDIFKAFFCLIFSNSLITLTPIIILSWFSIHKFPMYFPTGIFYVSIFTTMVTLRVSFCWFWLAPVWRPNEGPFLNWNSWPNIFISKRRPMA